MFKVPAVKDAISFTACVSVGVSLGRVGASSPKPLTLVGTATWLPVLSARVSSRRHGTRMGKLAKRQGRWVVGARDALRASASYPQTFCRMVAHLEGEQRDRRVRHNAVNREPVETILVDSESD